METKQYSISKEHCQKMIAGICSGCGGKLKPLETVDNAGDPTFWAGCENCQKFCWGISPKIYKIAARLVEERNYHPYLSMDKPTEKSSNEYKAYFRHSQIEGTIGIVQDVLNIEDELKNDLDT